MTGDLVSRDPAGYFTYAGRADDMLKVGGKWVAPAEVEDCLLGHAAVKECAVVGATDANGLVKPWAFVVRKEATPSAGGGPAPAPALEGLHVDLELTGLVRLISHPITIR